MAFKKWETKGKSIVTEHDLVRVTNKAIYIGKETLHKCFKSHNRITLYWDEERKVVGMSANSVEGLKLSPMKTKGKETGVLSLRWSKFVDHCKIHFDKPTNRKLESEGELWTFKP